MCFGGAQAGSMRECALCARNSMLFSRIQSKIIDSNCLRRKSICGATPSSPKKQRLLQQNDHSNDLYRPAINFSSLELQKDFLRELEFIAMRAKLDANETRSAAEDVRSSNGREKTSVGKRSGEAELRNIYRYDGSNSTFTLDYNFNSFASLQTLIVQTRNS